MDDLELNVHVYIEQALTLVAILIMSLFVLGLPMSGRRLWNGDMEEGGEEEESGDEEFGECDLGVKGGLTVDNLATLACLGCR